MTQSQPFYNQATNAPSWVDDRFEMYRPEYEAALRSVGFKKGWHVLDAGCGPGGFIPWIADEVGPPGQVTAMDVAEDTIELVKQRTSTWNLPCPLELKVGSFFEIPFDDSSFDAAWCSNAIDGVDEQQYMRVLGELKRVVRSGGIVAVKGTDIDLLRFYPGSPEYSWCFKEAAYQSDTDQGQFFRSMILIRGLRRMMEKAGLKDVWQKAIMLERWAPLEPGTRRFLETFFKRRPTTGETYGVSDEDMEFWRLMADTESPENPLNSPDFYWCEGQGLAVGIVP